MPAWWNSLETVTAISSHAKTLGFILGLLTALCGAIVFFSGKRVDALKAIRDADRRLTSIQHSQILDLMRDKPIGKVTVQCPIMSPEPRKFAKELAAVLKEAGWEVAFNDRVIFTQPTSGLEIWVHFDGPEPSEGASVTGDAPKRAETLLTSLRLAYLPTELRFNTSVPKDEVQLIVGFKP